MLLLWTGEVETPHAMEGWARGQLKEKAQERERGVQWGRGQWGKGGGGVVWSGNESPTRGKGKVTTEKRNELK